MRKLYIAASMLALLLVSFALSGCMSSSTFKEIKAQDLQTMLNAKETMTLVDVREARDYNNGHIPGAINIPITLFSERYQELKPNDKIVLICYSGQSSKSAAQFLLGKKYTNVSSVSGGMMDWSGAVSK